GSFEQVVANMPHTMLSMGGTSKSVIDVMNALYENIGNLPGMSQHKMGEGYAYDSYMRGRQYYYGFTLGAAYKVTDNLSVYGGARLLYGSANYYGYVKNIRVEHIENGQSQMVAASKHFSDLSSELSYYAGQMDNLGYAESAANLKAGAALAQGLSVNTQDIELNCDQTGWGIAPIVGVDYKLGKLNLAAKYEFKTRMRLKNKSANSESANNISMLDKYADGGKVAEDSPALLTVGAQYEIIPSLRVMAGWHHYFDVDTKQYTKAMLSDTNELLAGAEYNINKYIEVSAGVQKTDYNQNDVMMNDISYNVSSWSFGFGVGVKVAKNMKVNAAYFQTNYEDYNKIEPEISTTNCFTRTNRVIGLGLDVTL
ncbi:MAG: transporter, partial [Prevotella sp.]